MNQMLVGNPVAALNDPSTLLDQCAPVLLATRSTNGFFGGIVVGLTAMIPVWTGVIWIGSKLVNYV